MSASHVLALLALWIVALGLLVWRAGRWARDPAAIMRDQRPDR